MNDNSSLTSRIRLREALKRLFPYVKPYRLGFLTAVVLLTAKLALDVGFATIQQVFIDTINNTDMLSLTRITVICSLACLVTIICLMLQHYLRFTVHSRMSWDFRAKLFDTSHRLPYSQLEAMHSGDLTSRNTKDVGAAMGMISSLVYDLGYNLLLCLVAFLYLANMDVWLALLALGTGPVVFLSGRFFDRKLRKLFTQIYAQEALLRGILQETTQGMKVVRSFSLENMLLSRYATERGKLNQLQKQRTLLNALLWHSSAFINNAVMISCAVLIARSAMRGETTAGEVLAFILLMGRVQWPFVEMSQTWGGVQESLGAADRVFEILDATLEGEVSTYSNRFSSPGEVAIAEESVLSIQGLCYSFAGSQSKERAGLSEINLQLKHGETVAIVGPSGSGKTTLVRLCCGLYEPQAGSISVCGNAVNGQLEEARRMISYVPQNPYLFAGSIRENIAFSVVEASDGEIREAARLAGADEFIMRLPEGYDTMIGEHGSSLSGGQRQRLAIARAFLRNAPLLLLDEATSALDNESERLVQQSLERLMTDRTTLVIAHRLSTVRDASRIIVLDQGTIAEEGTHDALLEHNGLYASLYHKQFSSTEAGTMGSALLTESLTAE
ncbi:ABC transporter ATP-binding protein [Paenibacillus sp. FSL H3-0333]|uniref:ABC transporter ATP-binding protein n=1 Tax=Paenibacillus sp. FSL H3-0333 TaxID=2921373 RepID=UPI0030FAE726